MADVIVHDRNGRAATQPQFGFDHSTWTIRPRRADLAGLPVPDPRGLPCAIDARNFSDDGAALRVTGRWMRTTTGWRARAHLTTHEGYSIAGYLVCAHEAVGEWTAE